MLNQRLQQRLQQKLSPQQIQMIKLLELPSLQLEQRVKTQPSKKAQNKMKQMRKKNHKKMTNKMNFHWRITSPTTILLTTD
jgi:DNA-directed RNA polymerase specialized sigma54-like protein